MLQGKLKLCERSTLERLAWEDFHGKGIFK